ncbi:MAG TPA: TetR/AcrR family transcriptional regulator [Solirubrobacteraceae bacterium]|nr:TetR/AcrR family transcriptional regulator [Solirubrobacteraceae bacterium]
MPSPDTATKTLRADARRNHDRLVASARELFATAGLEVSVEEITQHAGVGMGTLYRHFPTKEELIDAVLEDTFTDFLTLAEAALSEDDPWDGLCRFFEQALAMYVRNRGLKDVVASGEHGRARAAAMRSRMWTLVTRLVERARQQGTLRPDFATEDVALVLWSGERVVERSRDVAPELWQRYLGLLLDGLRATAANELPAPPLTHDQLQAARSSASARRSDFHEPKGP